ncbi:MULTISPECIES: DUF6776 family protein [Aeromonas]|uniref:DUF6776 family protein n=1 Tax=Aeromonas TaxID=642 RepID=UPI000DDAFEE1|nr:MULTISPECIES: DUF6776 family protein [Aeromonas]AXA99934.1 hypothetical protein C1C92_02235 [Aeromonas caviae]QLL81866.1 hypothetical protein GWC92_17060 [Aeromonas caviae]QXB99391.1 hypothetical protein I6L48_00085 [Aeromonas sp. FDAARGOS 1418]UBS64731.1 hypothetical protein LCG53_17795 [Aeromonas caviae]WKS84186.1 hypothetical protein NHU86_16735 [Aeromonas caviae]
MSQIVKLLVVLAVGACIGYVVGNRQELAQSSLMTVQQETLERQSKAIAQLKTELGVRETLLATQKAAFEQLQQTLKDQEVQVQEQKRQLAFFERIMRPTGEQVGVSIDNLTLQETSVPGRYHYRLALTQPAKKRELFRGQVQIRLEGSLADKPRILSGRDLGMKVGEGRYALRYFQLLEGNWQLPSGFIPDRVRILIPKEGRQPAQELVAEWNEVLKPLIAQPAPLPAAQ